jgi:DNA-binding transcriptional MerR regulator
MPSDAPTPTDAGPRLSVAAVAHRLGVAAATLRTWDRRYGIGPTGHSSGSHRRYGVADLARLETMRRLVLDGVPPAEAARVALAQSPPDGAGPDAPQPQGQADGAAPAAASAELVTPHPVPDALGIPAPRATRPVRRRGAAAVPAAPNDAEVEQTVEVAVAELEAAGARSSAGGGRVLSIPGARHEVRGLARAAMALDAPACSAIIRSALFTRGAEATWTSLVSPVLVAVGRRWSVTGHGVDVEHLLSDAAFAAYRNMAMSLPDALNSRPVLLACAPDENHSLPLAVLAAVLAELGVGTRMLGAAVPADALAASVARTGPAVVVVWSQMRATGAPEPLLSVPPMRPPVRVLAAGPGWAADRLPPGVEPIDDLGSAVDLVLAALGLATG